MYVSITPRDPGGEKLTIYIVENIKFGTPSYFIILYYINHVKVYFGLLDSKIWNILFKGTEDC